MGLDVYVGSLTRYLAGDWETVVQKYGREQGVAVDIVREHHAPDAITDPAEIRPVVLEWRANLSAALQESGGPALDWDERADAPYFTDKPTWDAYGDLLLWATYHERSRTPPTESVEEWQDDAVLREALEGDSRFAPLFAQVWLPVDFDFTFTSTWPTGNETQFGSVQHLKRALDAINAETFDGAPRDLARWRREGKEAGEPLLTGARFALALLSGLADDAIRDRLVMMLDY